MIPTKFIWMRQRRLSLPLMFTRSMIGMILVSSAALVSCSANPDTASLRNALNMLNTKQRLALVELPTNLHAYNHDNNHQNNNKRKRSLRYSPADHSFHRADDYTIPLPLQQLEYDDYEDGNGNDERIVYLNNKYPNTNRDNIHLEHILNDNYNDFINHDSMQRDIDFHGDKNKKDVDWSQYFGIDKRKKKTGFYGRPDTQNEDDDWFVKHYYETLVQNLQKKNRDISHLSMHNFDNNNNDKESNKEQNKHPSNSNEMHNNGELKTRFRENVKNFLMKDQMPIKYEGIENIEDEDELQKIKDIIMNGLAASYSLQKMQEALNELKNNIRVPKIPSVGPLIQTKDR